MNSAPMVKLKHALIDVAFLNDDKIIELGELFGEAAQFYLIKILLLMSGTTGATITRIAAIGLRGKLSKSKANEIINFCIKPENQILTAIGDGQLNNSRVIKDQAACALTRQRQEKYRQKTNSVTSLDTSQKRHSDVAADTVSVIDTVTDLDSSNWLSNPLEWAPDEFEVAKEWVEHRKRRNKPLSDYQIEILMKNWNHDRAGFMRMAKHHIVNGHDNLYAESAKLPQKSQGPKSIKPSQNVVNQMASDEAVKVFLKAKGL